MSSHPDIEVIVKNIIEKIRSLEHEVNCAVACVSGGVDSTTSAILAKKALGEKVYAVFIDTGFMRLNEGRRVREALKGLIDLEIHDYSEEFISRIENISDAEDKRIAFREIFYTTVKRIAAEKRCSWIVQGTIKADVVETVGGVKTQHNVLSEKLLERYGFKVIEPLADLYKHEVRAIAKHLGLPNWITNRQPFPGPGLLVRTVGKLYREKLELVRRLTDIVEEMLKDKGFSQYFPAIWEYNVIESRIEGGFELEVYGVKVTGVIEGKRSYGHPIIVKRYPADKNIYDLYKYFDTKSHPHILVDIGDKGKDRGEYVVALRIISTENFMVAEVPKVDFMELKSVAEKILAKEPKVRLVAFDVTPKPPATIEYE
ncbi:MAG: GMP synthase [Ignisphaera sp.]